MKAARQTAQPAKQAVPKPADPKAPAKPQKRFGVIQGGERANHTQAGPLPQRKDGEKLPASLQERLARLVGARAASGARIHDDEHAAAVALAHDARAVTIGEHIYFREGSYRPGTDHGDALVAHEVAHVAQGQQGMLHGPALKSANGAEGGAHEEDADRVAKALDKDKKKAPLGAKQPIDDTNKDKAAKPGKPAAPTAQKDAAAAAVENKNADAPKSLPKDLPLMPEPAMELSKGEQKRVSGVENRQGEGAKATSTAPPAKENVSTAQAAVQVPKSESDARQAQQVVSDLAQLPPPSPEIVELCERIKKLIKNKRPADEEGVIDTRPAEVAKEAGGTVEGDVQKNVDDAKAAYGTIDGKPAGAAPDPGKPVEPIPADVDAPPVDAKTAVPDAVPEDQTSLDNDGAKMDEKSESAGLEKEPAQLVKEGPIAEARAAKGDMRDLAKTGPEDARKQQQAAIDQADADMAALQKNAALALKEARTTHVQGVGDQQGAFKGGEEALRAKLSADAAAVFEKAQKKVQDLLAPVHDTAMKKWTSELPKISNTFNDDLKVVKDKIDERHSGVSGFFVSGWDALTGLPGWVKEAYDGAEKNFGDGICDLITAISQNVNFVIDQAKKIVEAARDEIHTIFTANLPDGLKSWAEEQEKGFGKKLDALAESAEKTRKDFNKELIENAGGAVQAARERIQKLREEAGGLWGRFLDAVSAFLDDPVRFIINGLLSLLGIPPAAFWAVVAKIEKVAADIADDPVKFGKNLLAGIGRGFSQFFDRIGKHLAEGMIEWLLSGLKDVGITVEIPKEFSLKSTASFFLQILGISWMRIRKLLVEQLGEKPVAYLEKAAGVIYTLVTKGIGGILDDIKAMLDPKTILNTVIDVAVKFVTETLIEKVAEKIALLFIPGGAIIEALRIVYNVLKWIFTNAAKLFHFIEAVVDGMAAVVAGNLSGVANLIEKALAMLVAPVIDFLAEYLGLGALPTKVAQALQSLQNWVEGVMRRVIAWLVDMGKKLLAKLGFDVGDDKDKKKKKGSDEVGERVPFSGGGESHSIYIATSGAKATVMIASTPTPLEAWLDKAAAKADVVADDKQKAHAKDLVAKARGLLAKADNEADQVATAHEAAKSSNEAAPTAAADAKDEAVKSDEHQLSTVLAELSDLLGLDNVPKKLDATAVNLPRTEETPELILDLAKAADTTVEVRSEPDPKEMVKELIGKFGARFDPSQKTLTLRSAGGSAMAATKSLEEMYQSAAKSTGATRVAFAKSGKRFELTGHVGALKTKLAYGEVPPAVDLAAIVEVAKERHRGLFPKWTKDVAASEFKFNKEDEKTAWHDFTIAGAPSIAKTGTEALQKHVVETHIDTQDRLDKSIMAGGSARELFQVAAGKAVAEEAKTSAIQKLAAAIDDKEARDKVAKRITERVVFTDNSQLGHIDTPGGDSLHAEFRPIDIVVTESGSTITTTYTTKTGQSFKVSSTVGGGPADSIVGTNLSQKTQGGPQNRGVTQDSTWYVPGLLLNRSHLIADEFKGPGYGSARNVISVSADYNQETMRDAEIRIGDKLRDTKAISFDMTVSVSWSAEIAFALSAAVLGAPWYVKDDDTTEAKKLRDEMFERLKGLRRCLAVKYAVTVVKAETGGKVGNFGDGIADDEHLLAKIDLGKKK